MNTSNPAGAKEISKLEKVIQGIRKRLRAPLKGLEGNPISLSPSEKAYYLNFKLSFPTSNRP